MKEIQEDEVVFKNTDEYLVTVALGSWIDQFGQGSIEVKLRPRTRRTEQCKLKKKELSARSVKMQAQELSARSAEMDSQHEVQRSNLQLH